MNMKLTDHIASCLILSLLASCSLYTPHPPAEIKGNKQVYKEEVVTYGRDYQVSPGDEIEVTYHVDLTQQDKYHLAIGDQIRIEFYHYPQLDRTLDVRPDGRVTLPYKGDIMAAGRTPMGLSGEIDKTFADFLKHPKSTVSLIRYGQRIRDLKDAIKTAPRGQSRSALVQPDGKISLPLLPSIMVAGQTIDTAGRSINQAYDGIIPGMFTSTALLSAKGNIFYIMGNVGKPGYYELKGPATVLQGVAMAGGFTPRAQSSSVLLITRDEQNRAVGRVIDASAILTNGNIGTDTLLRQSDVIYVPNTKLAEAAIVFEFIRSFIPYNFAFSYGLQQNVQPDFRLP